MKVGIADTTFARFDMGGLAEQTLMAGGATTIRYTVPGIKDLPIACKLLLEEHGCEIALACGMVGRMEIDLQCSHEASLGIQQAQLLTNRHILEIFVHANEAEEEEALAAIFKDRVEKHCLNALALLKGRDALRPHAGKGRRQGHDHAGPLEVQP